MDNYIFFIGYCINIQFSNIALGPMLEVDGGWCIYLEQCKSYSHNLDISTTDITNKYKSIVISPAMRALKSRNIQGILSAPDEYGYKKHHLIHDFEILIKD